MESGNLRRALKAKSHLSVENANLRAEIERLRAALQKIADTWGSDKDWPGGDMEEAAAYASIARAALKSTSDD